MPALGLEGSATGQGNHKLRAKSTQLTPPVSNLQRRVSSGECFAGFSLCAEEREREGKKTHLSSASETPLRVRRDPMTLANLATGGA